MYLYAAEDGFRRRIIPAAGYEHIPVHRSPKEGDKAVESESKSYSDFSEYAADELTLNEQTLPVIIQVADHLPGGFFIYKAYGNEEIVYVNRHMLRICGCDNREQFEEMTGGTFRGFVHP